MTPANKKRPRDEAMEVKELAQLDNPIIQQVTNLTNTLREMGLNKDLDVPSTVVVGDTSGE